jgi:hypothetical protein
MALHKNLTGSDLHEPKGVAAALSGQVYISNGAGTGVWTAKNADILNANLYTLTGYMADIGSAGAPSGSVYFFIPQKSEIISFTSVVHAALVTADAVLSVYIDGVLFADSLTVPFTGSTAGQRNTKTAVTANTTPANSLVEIRSNGGPTTVVPADITFYMRTKV